MADEVERIARLAYGSFSNHGTVSRFLCPRGSNHVLNILPIYILLTSKQWGLIVVVRSFTATEVVYCHFATKPLREMRFMYAATLTFSLSQVHPLILIVGMLHLSRNRIA